MSDIFLSYARQDRGRVGPLVEALESRGWKVFWDRAIRPGKMWDRVIETALQSARCVVVLWSRESVGSDEVLDEAHEARRRGVLIPARLDDAEIPYRFRRIHTADLAVWPGEIEHLVAAVSEVLGVGAPVEPGLATGEVRTNLGDGLEYVWIPPGKFRMGCSEGDRECRENEQPAHEVEITRGFWIGRTPVTQAAYERLMKANPSNFKGAEHPVEQVTWKEALEYCRAAGVRLPNEAEWEYAARAGSRDACSGAIDSIAWYSGNTEVGTRPVALKQANAWGLHDVLGNVWEWCGDWYGPYEAEGQKDPRGPAEGDRKVARGGSWVDLGRWIRVSRRFPNLPAGRSFSIGFRCVGDWR